MTDSVHDQSPSEAGMPNRPARAAWVCADCDETYKTINAALAHSEKHDHWLYEHAEGFRGNAPTRSMHASDHGGCYVDDVDGEHARRLADSYRRRTQTRTTSTSQRCGRPQKTTR